MRSLFSVKIPLLLMSLLCILPLFAQADDDVIWTAVFSDFTPINDKVDIDYCQSHTPSVIVTTIKQITSSKGVTGLNGVNIRYLSYKTEEKDNLYFNLVHAIVSGKGTNGKSWSEKMTLYEQTLDTVGVTYTVWSTPHCKGTFLGTPTRVSQ
ncbi:hypothetical protein [uncultured Shewanella sp.]|uniref:hypothetical protein n=1 Tax=uncultured Shewanella sp. TaxID=173975 RepID=UPI0026083B81|nr:hypothetical protein [uncultured Shewanella sp.]